MLVGILADTHDEFDRTENAVDQLCQLGVSSLFHCGDLFSARIIEICCRLPFYFVFGNHDADMTRILQEAAEQYGASCLEWGGQIKLCGKTIAMVHGHLTSDLQPLLKDQPDYLFSGHFHEPKDWMVERTRRINPGALHRADRFTVATLDLQSDELTFFDV